MNNIEKERYLDALNELVGAGPMLATQLLQELLEAELNDDEKLDYNDCLDVWEIVPRFKTYEVDYKDSKGCAREIHITIDQDGDELDLMNELIQWAKNYDLKQVFSYRLVERK